MWTLKSTSTEIEIIILVKMEWTAALLEFIIKTLSNGLTKQDTIAPNDLAQATLLNDKAPPYNGCVNMTQTWIMEVER